MIDADFVRMMARYNSWQNRQVTEALKDVPDADLQADRGAFFGSIMATINHLLWGDTLWMSRFTPKVAPPRVPAAKHKVLTPTFSVWSAERFQMDGAIELWARKVKSFELLGDLSWYSDMNKQQMRQPFALCVVQFFNHQTHHRGQVHAMMTSLGLDAPVSDLAFMPKEA
ncbi:MAG: DinB family protein [Pseudomonadota bacterium]